MYVLRQAKQVIIAALLVLLLTACAPVADTKEKADTPSFYGAVIVHEDYLARCYMGTYGGGKYTEPKSLSCVRKP